MKMSRFLNENRKKLPESEKMDMAEHRRQLMEKVIKSKRKKETENSSTPKKKTTYSTDAKLEIKKLERQLRLTNQNNIRLQHEKSELQKRNRSKQKQLRKLRAEKDNFNQKIKKIELEYEEKNKELDQKLKQKNEEISHLQKVTSWIDSESLAPGDDVRKLIDEQNFQIELLSTLFAGVMRKNTKLAEKITLVREDRNTYQKQAKEYKREVEHLTKFQNKLESKVKSLIDENDSLLRKYRNKTQLKNAPISELIQLLIDKCSPETITDYAKLDYLKQYYQQVLESTQRHSYSYGYIEETSDQFLLHDINKNSVYPVFVPERLRNNSNYSSGIVVRCHYKHKNWIVDHLYPTISIESNISRISKFQKNHKSKINQRQNEHKITITNQAEINWLKNLNVVLVGNKYSAGFVNEMKKYCNLKIFDAYEDGEQQIFKAMHSADYVFLLIGSVPHSITVYSKATEDLNEYSNKMQIFDIPAKYDGVIRLHYLYANFGNNDKVN
ncbi:hypothetical protein [Lactobacillus sp. LL6]|uniref:coiled-coil domain-containing protein n=1 Tax=Lactobacillus sp. LL6 TaxID=2596827 RepID=UPI001184856B|nr:hypothetical protein [Lactobacillus sp. LL6]TSO25477.1 hypothetical protein FOD82_09640 [Lactobacillus sp. LL6]